jgi:hypothetical protein
VHPRESAALESESFSTPGQNLNPRNLVFLSSGSQTPGVSGGGMTEREAMEAKRAAYRAELDAQVKEQARLRFVPIGRMILIRHMDPEFLPPLGTHFLAGVLTHENWPITCVNPERSKPVGRRAAGQQSIQVIRCSRAFSGRSQIREACRHHRWPVAPPRLSPRLMLSLTTRAPLARWANINCPPTLDPPSTLPLSVKRDALYAGRLVSGIHSPWSK